MVTLLRHLAVAGSVLLLSVAASGCGSSNSTSSPMAGQYGYIKPNVSGLAAIDITTYKRMYNDGVHGNTSDIQSLIDSGQVVEAGPRDKVYVVSNVADGGEKVEFKTGRLAGQTDYMTLNELSITP